MEHDNKPDMSDKRNIDVDGLYRRLNELEEENRRLKTEADRFGIITAYMNDGLFIINGDGTYDYFNEKANNMTRDPEEIRKVGDSFKHTRYFDIKGRELSKDGFPSARVLRGETINNVRLKAERPGFSGWFSYSGCPVYDDAGMITSAIVCFRDVTKIYDYEQEIRQQKEQLEASVESLQEQKELLETTVKKLEQSEMQLKMASEGAHAGIYAFDFESGKGMWSPMFNLLHGFKDNESVPLDKDGIYTGLHPQDRERFLEAMKEVNNPDGNGIADLEYRIILPDGTTRWLHIRGQTHFTGEGENKRLSMTGGAIMDVTDRVLAELKIRKLSEELRKIIDSTDDLVWSVDKDYRLLYFNASFRNEAEKIFGVTMEEGVILREVLPKEAPYWEEFYERAMTDGKFQVDLPTQFNDKTYAFSFYPIYIDSEIVEIAAFARDLTERMRTEKKIVNQNVILETTVRERTEELQRLVKDLRGFSLALSHDVKASYRDIEVCAGNILRNVDVAANSKRILQVSKNMTSFIHEIMNYEMYTRKALNKDDVNIKNMFTSVYKELKLEYTNKTKLAFETGFPVVSADAKLLRQVVINVLSNALKFTSKRELAVIKIGCTEKNNEYVIYVKDNGIGFDMTDASKLFTPFERLHAKDEYEGNGLGLSIVRNIIKRHGGQAWIESQPDIGTTVYFSLPIT
jgi:signal transduction histidine kinase